MDPALRELLRGEPEALIEVLLKSPRSSALPSFVHEVARFGEIAACRVPRAKLVELHGNVASLKAPRIIAPEPTWPRRPSPQKTRPQTSRARTPESGRGTVVGIIDWGCDFAHPNFRYAGGNTRLLALWDQRGLHRQETNTYRRGTIYGRRAIDRALASGAPYRALGYHPADADPGDGAHGTHTMDIAAGNGRVGRMGIAPAAELVFVHLAGSGIEGLNTLGDSVALLEAVHFIFRVAGERPCVINLSVGTHGGPHDGSTLIEQALDAALIERSGRAIVHSCGNYYDRAIHASGRIAAGATHRLAWNIGRLDRTENELEIWYSGRDRLLLELRAPDGSLACRAPLGSAAPIAVSGREIGRAYHRAGDPNNGDHQVDIFLSAVEPGLWSVALIGEVIEDGRFDAWIERDLGLSDQSRFEPADVDARTTINTICNGLETIAVGAYDARTGEVAPFSSSGPTRDGRTKPDLLAPGIDVAGARSSVRDQRELPWTIEKSGTSMAAPSVTGAIALMFEAAGRKLTHRELKQILLDTARPFTGASANRDRAGAGYLDIEAAVREARVQKKRPVKFEIIGRPRQKLARKLQRGDIVLRAPLGEGGPSQGWIVASAELRRASELSGLYAESTSRGWYAEGTERVARRVLDEDQRVPLGHVVLRLRRSEADPPLAENDPLYCDPPLPRSTKNTSNFKIFYSTDPEHAPDLTASDGDIVLPGTTEVVGRTEKVNKLGKVTPNYVQRVAFWMEYARKKYVEPPFSFKAPSTTQQIIKLCGKSTDAMGGGGFNKDDSFRFPVDYGDDDLAILCTHELMHTVIRQYSSSEPDDWRDSINEGGCVLCEDFVLDAVSRYIADASRSYICRSGEDCSGILRSPERSLKDVAHMFALFLRYMCEQQAQTVTPADEPEIGVEAFRTLLEHCAKLGYNDTGFKAAVRALPWHQDFFELTHDLGADPDLLSGETLLGNFWLACALKDSGGPIERRFDFMEKKDASIFGTLIGQSYGVTQGLAPVDRWVDRTLSPRGFIPLHTVAVDPLPPFAARFFKLRVHHGVEAVRLQFTADSSMQRPLVQIAELDADLSVRDVHRSDRGEWTLTITNLRGARALDRLEIAVATTDTGGGFTLSASAVEPCSDVSLTRWNCAAGTSYEVDSFGWSWTWSSPDLWIDNGGSTPHLLRPGNNELFVRLRNRGGLEAREVSLQLFQQAASGVPDPTAWVPIVDSTGARQEVSGLTLAPGEEKVLSAHFAPPRDHKLFSLRAVVTSPGDVNAGGKRCVSNLAAVKPGEIPLPARGRASRVELVPRAQQRWSIEQKTESLVVKAAKVKAEKTTGRTKFELSPGAKGHYPADPRIVPPGYETYPLITLVHLADDRPIGGYTFAIVS